MSLNMMDLENVTEASANNDIIEEYVTQLNMMFMTRSLKIRVLQSIFTRKKK